MESLVIVESTTIIARKVRPAMKMIHNTNTGPIIVCDPCFERVVEESKRSGVPIDFEDVYGKVPNHQTCDLCGESLDWLNIMKYGNGTMYIDGIAFAEVKDIQIRWGKSSPYNISDQGDKVP
jgi:hypothetical protein